MIKPVSPTEIQFELPDDLVTAINNQLKKGLVFTIKDLNYEHTFSCEMVKLVYEQYGWSVEYDRPGYNETYSTSFTFKPKPRYVL